MQIDFNSHLHRWTPLKFKTSLIHRQSQMGGGGQAATYRAPVTKPTFTLGEIKRAIPPHCFEQSLLRSFYYLFQDLFFVSILYYVAANYFHYIPHPLNYLAWMLYIFFQGCAMMGLWILGHECGHGAFTGNQVGDDVVGLFVHSVLLVPYFSFKISHRRHHINSGLIDRDEVHVPPLKHDRSWIAKFVDETPALKTLLWLLLGYQLYLSFNVFGRRYKEFASHFYPGSPMFSNGERVLILITDVGVLTMIYGLYCLAQSSGLQWMLWAYFAPWFMMNAIIVAITYLNHTSPSLPRYDSSDWDWLRGSLTTVDRDYGAFFNYIFHNLTDTHVVHHLFPRIPHYYAKEATKAMMPIAGEYYQFDNTPPLKAVWREIKECSYVEPDENKDRKGVYWFNNKP